jgi:hypothetical protein
MVFCYIWNCEGIFIADISNIKNSPQLDGDLLTAPKQPPGKPGQVIVDQQPVSNKKKVRYCIMLF